jgi:endonuclease YncB( thermonuclease family)
MVGGGREVAVTRRGRTIVAVIAGLAAVWGPAGAHQAGLLNGTVVRVQDGDTVVLDTGDEERIEIRLSGVDCPESAWPDRWEAQPGSAEAKEFTRNMVLGKEVTVRLKDEVSYDRAIGEIFVDGRSLNRELLRAGLAWWNKRYEPSDLDLKRLAAAARKERKGLWQAPKPVPPWEHRRGQD